MSEAWEIYAKQPVTPLLSKPLCGHQLAKERIKLCTELLALTVLECGEEMPSEAAVALTRALAEGIRLQSVLKRQKACRCKRYAWIDPEEEGDAPLDDSDEC
jgi:hypothetical protein